MREHTEKIQQIARRLLSEGKVDCFVGFRRGSVPMVPGPVVIRRAEDAEQLIWDSSCGLNLSSYLHGLAADQRVGLCVTGCSSRNVVVHIQEKQVVRERIYLVGVPCTGIVDPLAVQAAVGSATIVDVSDRTDDAGGEQLVVELAGGERKTLAKAELLQRNCRTCAAHNPVLSDELVSEQLVADEVTEEARFADVAAVEALEPAARWERFQQAYAGCIRCYACRQACPECYCPTCFVDESRPQWLGKSSDPDDTLTFHLLRAFHMAGRCTECGACERACPMDLDVRFLTKKLVKDAHALFGYTAGDKPDGDQDLGAPLLDAYRTDDPDDFIY